MAILRQSAKDLVYEALKEKILKQEYNLGDPLNIVHLSAEFGTSNTPIREALSRLESEGLVTSSLNSKFRVTELTEESSHELNNTILILLQGGLSLCIKEGKTAELEKELSRTLEKQLSLYDSADAFAYVMASLAFDRSFVAAAGNARLLRIFDTQANLFSLSMSYSDKKSRQSNLAEHKAILAAIKEGDYANVNLLLEKHYDKHVWDF